MSQGFIGKEIGGCKIIREIGCGGCGMVFLATHKKYGENVVLKILPIENIANDQSKKRFEREIKVSIELVHPNIVKVFEANADNENYFIVMEFVDGLDTEKIVEKEGPFYYKTATKIILNICEALEFAHNAKIIHRDIKPSNILLDKNNNAKLCDFGLAKDLKETTELTSAGMVLGTPNFMSPEQWFGAKDLTHQSDIFSLGSTFYYLLTGVKPFAGEDPTSIMTNSLFGLPDSPKKYVSSIPQSLCKIINIMMEREIQNRYSNIKDIKLDLVKILNHSNESFFKKIFG